MYIPAFIIGLIRKKKRDFRKSNPVCIKCPKVDKLIKPKRNGVDFMDTIALILTIVGALNWGLIGLAKFDLVAWIFGGQTAILSRIIYALVGLAGLWCITLLFRKGNRQ